MAEPIDGTDLRLYSGVYVEAIQEGAQVFELTEDGLFKLYEMWQTTESGEYKLVMIESLPIRLGSHGNQPALMADDFFLLLPISESDCFQFSCQTRKMVLSNAFPETSPCPSWVVNILALRKRFL